MKSFKNKILDIIIQHFVKVVFIGVVSAIAYASHQLWFVIPALSKEVEKIPVMETTLKMQADTLRSVDEKMTTLIEDSGKIKGKLGIE